MADKSDKIVSSALVDAVRKVRIASAERSDVVDDMKEADRARLEILGQRLQPVFDDVPVSDTRFDFVISSGLQPRLWIDATAHVLMGRDRRTYRFVRDTRLGRITMAESSDPAPIADAVTTYIAERLHERELAFAADEMISLRSRSVPLNQEEKPQGISSRAGPAKPIASKPTPASAAEPQPKRASETGTSQAVLWMLGLFIVIGTLVLVFGNPQ